MGENNNIESRVESSNRRDGNIDFSRYATEQLEELRDNLDPAASPLNHAALLAELERRVTSAEPATRWTGRFTRWSGIVGWLSSKLRRAPLYGAGTLEAYADHLTLHGWQRTWLGIGIERALNVPLQRIRNAIATERGLRFEIRRAGWVASKVEFRPAEPADREAIVRALPQTQTSRFGRYGASLITFEEQLRARCPVAWLTPVLVLLNVLAFCALWIQAGSLAGVTETPLALLTANVGPLTLEGQWWRLLSALFVHADLAHLILNMWALWNIGLLSERLYGRWTFLGLYLGCGSIASLSSLVWDPARSSIGASGAIFALFGVFLAHLLKHRRELPRGIFRSHWIPTLLFVGFNLFSGAVQAGIDNAAHVGGLLSGFVLGLLLARTTDLQVDSSVHSRRALALGVYLVTLGAAFFYLYGTRGPVPVAQQFVARNAWYISGEAKSNAAWRQLANAAAAGTITDEVLGARVKKEVLPFWVEAVPKLEAETSSSHDEQKRYLEAIAHFAKLRKEWAEAVISTTTERDQKQGEVARAKDAEAVAVVARVERLATRSNAARLTGGLVNLPVVQRLRSHLTSKHGDCVGEPAGYDVVVSDLDSPTDSPVMRKRAGCQAQQNFLSGDFKALDAMFAEAAVHTGDLPGGDSTLAGASGGISDLWHYGTGTINEYQRQLAMWRRAMPHSYYPDIMEVELYQAWAWSARGHGTVSQVTQQAWVLFSYRNEMAQAALDDTSEAARHDPVWCDVAMSLQHDRSNEIKPIEQVFRTCSAEFPGYLALYRDMLRSLMPRWHGSADQVTDFIERAADAESEERRDAMYARLYWIYSNLENDEVNIFGDADADWLRVHQGFEDLMKQYPRSDVLLNAHARFACLAGDGDVYRALEAKMPGRKSASAWTLKTRREDCDSRFRKQGEKLRP